MTIVMDIKANENSIDLIPNEWVHNDSFETLNTFKRFLNWLSSEFTLNLQDEQDGLKVFFPNGLFTVKELKSDDSYVKFKVTVQSKCLKNGNRTFEKIIRVLNHVKNFKR